MNPITFENITKKYNNKTVLNDISLSFNANITTTIIGPSGSGKSTLIQMINGLIRPDTGKICLFDKEIDYKNLAVLRRQIGYAVQGTGLFPHLTIEKNITLLAHLENWNKHRIKTRMEELMGLVDIPISFVTRYPHELSGGEQQRIGLCRAMMLNPRIFLLDEAFGALDPITRSEIHIEFLKLQKSQARTIVFVTHDLREAIKLADTIIILNEGSIEQIGSCDDILKQPASEFVKRFVHSQLEDNIA